jgi:hypothetical protein
MNCVIIITSLWKSGLASPKADRRLLNAITGETMATLEI